jgi:peptidoglycan hydrolase-like protein with peptidoglycan-binding domain
VVRVLALVLAVLVASGASAQEEPRWALVIGNDDYRHVPTLMTAVNDARAVAATLERLGFTVLAHENLDRRGMNRAVRQFADRVLDGVGVVYFAGHGVQLRSGNYLLPVDIEAGEEGDVEDDAVSLSDLMTLLAGARARLVIAFVDACRDNPLPPGPRGRSLGATRGLGQPAATPSGTMVVYSAGTNERALDGLGPGDESPNGLFVRELLPELERPGVAIDDAVDAAAERVAQKAREVGHDQNPAIYKAYRGKFYLARGAAGAGAEPPQAPPDVRGAEPPPSPGLDPRAPDMAFWDSVKGSRNPADYEAYLEQFPAGIFARLARNRLAELEAEARQVASMPRPSAPAPVRSEAPPPTAAAPTPEAVEAALDLSREDWRNLQRALTALSFDTLGADGRPGQDTRRAIAAWQTSKRQKATGYLADLQQELILSEAQPRLAVVAKDSVLLDVRTKVGSIPAGAADSQTYSSNPPARDQDSDSARATPPSREAVGENARTNADINVYDRASFSQSIMIGSLSYRQKLIVQSCSDLWCIIDHPLRGYVSKGNLAFDKRANIPYSKSPFENGRQSLPLVPRSSPEPQDTAVRLNSRTGSNIKRETNSRTNANISVYNRPAFTQSLVIGRLTSGEEVFVKSCSETWCIITHPHNGYVARGNVASPAQATPEVR